jgi:hypothetical protein
MIQIAHASPQSPWALLAAAELGPAAEPRQPPECLLAARLRHPDPTVRRAALLEALNVCAEGFPELERARASMRAHAGPSP